MAEVTKIIMSLGVDETLWIQLGLFLFFFVVLKIVVFNPYFKAYLERQSKTTGNETKAEEIYAHSRELEALYQRKLRGLNADMKEMFDRTRTEATGEQEKIQTQARERAKLKVEAGRKQIASEYNNAREELMKETLAMGQVISAKLLSKEAH